MAQTVKWLAFSCVHCPLQDAEAVDWLLSRIAFHQPNLLVCLGDLLEADSASRWPSEYDWDLQHEFDTGSAFLADVRKSAPLAERVFLEGNHDANLLSLNRIDRKLRRLCDYREKIDELANWQRVTEYNHCRRKGVYRVGQVAFYHGFRSGVSGDEFDCIDFVDEWGLGVRGHSHKPVQVTQALKTKSLPLRYWFLNVGCMRDLNPPYMHRNRKDDWGHALGVGEAKLLKSPRRCREWSAQVEVLRTYGEIV